MPHASSLKELAEDKALILVLIRVFMKSTKYDAPIVVGQQLEFITNLRS